jgi:uncharacterized protein involved in response to NO
MFAAGMVQGCLAMAWWLMDMLGRYHGWPTAGELRIPPGWAHAYLLAFGFFPFFMFGFLMTALPSWMEREKPGPGQYLPATALMFLGVTLFYPGIYWSEILIYLGIALQLTGWLVGLYALGQRVHTRGRDRRHALLAVAGIGAGSAALLVFDFAMVTHAPGAAAVALSSSIWVFLLPVFLTVAHRMIPFFSSRVLPGYRIVRPYWALWTLAGCGALHGVLMMAGLLELVWLADIPAAGVALYLVAAWRVDRSLGIRLLAVLHIAFAWVPVAFLLSATQSLLAYQYVGAGAPVSFGLAPLHALTIGFFSSMLVGMASRVILGHSGRPLEADTATWVLFWGMNLSALLRILADMPWAVGVVSDLLPASSALWLAGFVFWTSKYLPMLLLPRVDGEPG